MKKLAVFQKYSEIAYCISFLEKEEEHLKEWTFLVVDEPTLEDVYLEVNTISLKERFGFTPPFMPLISFCVFQVIREEKPELVIFCGSPAVGYFSLLERRQGGLSSRIRFWLFEPHSRALTLEKDQKFPAGRTDVELNALEEDSIHRFDRLIDSADVSFVEWARAAGWSLPANTDNKPEENHLARDIPYISVCLATFNRPELLSLALKSLAVQTFDNFEVIVVDDGSDPKHGSVLKALEERYAERGWRFYSQSNSGPAVARNFAASVAKGSHLLFMDDDNWALANEIELFSGAVRYSNADIFTCIPGWHPESELEARLDLSLPTNDPYYPVVSPDWIPVGGFCELGVFINCFGDTNALIRKDIFHKLDGFATDKDLLLEDVDLFTRAVVEGYRLEVIPHILFLYRKHESSRSWNEHTFQSHIRSLQPYKQFVDKKLWPLILCHRKGFYDRHVAISSDVNDKKKIVAGEWLQLPDGNNEHGSSGAIQEYGWLPPSGARISFFVENPGKSHSLLFDVVGTGVLKFEISEKKYVLEIDANKPSIIECAVLPGAIQSLGETSIVFDALGNILVRRLAVIRQGG